MVNPPTRTNQKNYPRRKSRQGGHFILFYRIIWTSILGIFIIIMGVSCGGPLPPNDPFNLAEAKDNLARGNHWYLRGCHNEALKYFNSGVVFARLADNVPYLIMSLNAKGASEMALKQYKQSAETLVMAWQKSLAEPGNPGLPAILGNLGALELLLGNRAEAEEFFLRGLSAATEQRENPAPFLASLARLALTQNNNSQFETYLNQARESLDLPDTSNDARADILNLLATQSLKDGDLFNASLLISEALELDRAAEDTKGIIADLLLLSEIETLNNSPERAYQSLDRAFYLAVSQKDTEKIRLILDRLKQSHTNHNLPLNLSNYNHLAQNPSLFDPFAEICP
ncbi:MAG: hypothetical protein LBF22_12770 [Deltaproteobacteria bacterium]|jgi:tetratricopeptide (TPR) repeat protein|nr:hypothetical protein [Deltaproteobacteria bacterium]